jgi:hypothetical protein
LGRSQGTITLLTAVIVLVTLLNSVGYVHAASLTVDGQAGSGLCNNSCSVSLSTSNSNDVILVLAGGSGGNGLNFGTPTATGLTFNTRKTLYTVVLPPLAPTNGVGEWWAVASSALSSKTITLTESTGADYAMIVYAISGADTVTPFDPDVVLPATAKSSSPFPPFPFSSTVTVSTSNPNDVIFGIVGGGADIGGGSAGTSGFTIWSVNGNPAAAEYNIVSSIQSGLTVTINFGASSNWSMIGDAVQAAPAVTSTTTTVAPIPEYPLGLLLLAILTVFAYVIVRRRSSYKKTSSLNSKG